MVCNSEEGSQGLEYRLSGNGEFYTLTGMGTCKDRELVIPGKYKGKPVRVIEEFAFSRNMNITRVDISDSVEVIKAGAFSGCDNIFTITLGEGLCDVSGLGRSMRIQEVFNRSRLDEETLRTSGFGEMISTYETSRVEITKDDFAFYVEGDNVSLIGYVGDKKDIVLPSSYNGHTYVIGEYAFFRGEYDSIVLSEGVTEIKTQAFGSFLGFNNLVIPKSVKKIESGAFYGTGITSVTIPSTVETVEVNAFFECFVKEFYCEAPSKPQGWHDEWSDRFKIVIWDCKNNDVAQDGYIHVEVDGIKYGIANGEATVLGANGTVENANILENVSFKGKSYSVTSINAYVFYGRENLKSVTIPDSITDIGDMVFESCISLETVTLPEGTQCIGKGAFLNCESLKSVTIPGSVKSISESAFEHCLSLETVTIQEGTESIGKGAFLNCESLKSVTIPGSVKSISESAFRRCSNLETVTIQEGAESIGSNAFSTCQNLRNINIPSSVTSIGDGAFQICTELESVIIPGSVKNMGYSVFFGCRQLTIYCEALSEPENWSRDWSSRCAVEWGYSK